MPSASIHTAQKSPAGHASPCINKHVPAPTARGLVPLLLRTREHQSHLRLVGRASQVCVI